MDPDRPADLPISAPHEPPRARAIVTSLPRLALAAISLLALLSTVLSSLSVYPHSLAYFNEGAGGPENGWRHLLGSNLDWGQSSLLAGRIAARSLSHSRLFLSDVMYDVEPLAGSPAFGLKGDDFAIDAAFKEHDCTVIIASAGILTRDPAFVKRCCCDIENRTEGPWIAHQVRPGLFVITRRGL